VFRGPYDDDDGGGGDDAHALKSSPISYCSSVLLINLHASLCRANNKIMLIKHYNNA